MPVEIQIAVSKALRVKVTGDTQKEAIEQLSLFSDLPAECPRCQAPVTLKHREHDGNDYYEAVCMGDPFHKANLGQYKNNKGLYFKPEEKWKTLSEITGNRSSSPPQRDQYPDDQPRPSGKVKESSLPEDVDDDLPF